MALYLFSVFSAIKYFPSNLRPEDYTGKWTLDDMADFVIKKTGAKATFRPRIPRDIKDVNVGNFEEIVLVSHNIAYDQDMLFTVN